MTTTLDRAQAPDLTDATPTVAWRARQWALQTPEGIAMREKDFGIWQEYSWGRTWDLILEAAHGLLALGVEVGDRVSIQSEDRPQWIILDLATVAIRAMTAGLYSTNPRSEVEYLLNDSGAKVHLAEDQEQVDKVLGLGSSRLPSLERIIFVEPRGVRNYQDPRLLGWDQFLEMGRRHRKEHPYAVEELMAQARPEDVITLVYTSGTTGPPKGAMLTNGNSSYCIDQVVNVEGRMSGNVPPNPNDLVLTYLPLCHIAERIFSTWTMVGNGVVLNFAESIETVQMNLREIQPTLFFAVPRIWEKIHAMVMIKASDASLFKKLWFGLGMKSARVIGRQRVGNGGDHTWVSRLVYALLYVPVFRPLRDRVGLRRCRWAGSGAAPIAPEVLEFFIGIGVATFELYGMTENAAVATANFPGRTKLGTVGEPYPGIGFRIDEETGEIQTKHPAVFVGYWNKAEKTKEAFTEDGWLKTGDVGTWVQGTHVRVVDRIKDIIITSGGKNISPSEIENSLKTSPFIKEAMVVGDRRNYLSALISIEYDTVGDWALRHGLTYTTYRDLSEKPEVIELIQKEIDKTNEKSSRVEGIKKFRMIPKELDHEDGELTATQKLKRSAMVETFSDLVESMY